MRHQSASRIAVMVLLLIPYLPVILLLLPPIAAHFDAIIRSVDPGYRGFRGDPEEGVMLAAVYAGLVTLYLAPALIAYLRWHRNLVPIFIVNAVLGSTGIGWIVALAWSFSSHVVPASPRAYD